MNSFKPSHVLAFLWVQLAAIPSFAQNGFSLQQAIEYALQKNMTVKNAQLESVAAEAKIGETRAIGLPQVNANFAYTNNIIIQKMVVPANLFDPSQPADAPPLALEFGIKNTGSFGATLNQLLFNGSYFVGLKAATTYRELAQKGVTQSKVAVAEAVSKAYYSVQVAEAQAKVLDLNLERLDTTLRETKAMNEGGFVERIDVDRIEVQLNNMKSERQKVSNLISLSKALLKFQMGMGQEEELALTDSLDANLNLDEFRSENGPAPVYENRIEYALLHTQAKLAELDIKNIRAGYLPVVSASIGYGHNNGRTGFGEMFSSKWYNNSAFNFNLQVPIFDGLTKHYQLQQKKIARDKISNDRTQLKQSIDLEVKQANTNITNNLETLVTHQRNVDLAKEVVRVSKIKYKEGVGSNIEVINAESSLKEAQTNYFASLYDLLIAKVELQKALGELYQEK